MGTSLTASDLAKSDSEGGAGGRLTAVADFNLLLSLSDYTGELEGMWLGGQAARDILNDSVSLYYNITHVCESRIYNCSPRNSSVKLKNKKLPSGIDCFSKNLRSISRQVN